jgi:hypothetical protein
MQQIMILESFPEGDDKVGKAIHETLEKESPGFSRYFDIESKENFFTTIELILSDFNQNGLPCFLHIDCHGDEEGIELKNGDCIDWEEFRSGFRDLYISTGKNLIICMSACKGFHASKMVVHSESCPYHAICGSFEDIGFAESENGYLAFYRTLIQDKSIIEAIDEVNKVEPSLKFIGYKADQLFSLAINAYLKKLTPEYLENEKRKKIKLVESVFQNDANKIAYINNVYTLQGQKMILNNRYKKIFFS